MDYLPKTPFLNQKVLSDINAFCTNYSYEDNSPLVIACISLDNLPIIMDMYSKDFAEKVIEATTEKVESILKENFCQNFIVRRIGNNLISFAIPKLPTCLPFSFSSALII